MSTPAKKRAARKIATTKTSRRQTSPSTAATPVSEQAPKKNLLAAGIKALANAHDEAVARQSRVFESLLGLGQGLVPKRADGDQPNTLASAALDPFGIKKFEDVFDQRVAHALQRLGVPSSGDVKRLEGEIAALRDEVARLRTQLAKR